MAGRLDALRCLQNAYLVIRRLATSGADVAGKDGKEAWAELKLGISKAGGDVESILAEVTDDPAPILAYIAAFTAKKRMYRSQAESILDKLLRLPHVHSIVRGDSRLRARLRLVAGRAATLLGDAEGEELFEMSSDGEGDSKVSPRGEPDDCGDLRRDSSFGEWTSHEVGPAFEEEVGGPESVPEDVELRWGPADSQTLIACPETEAPLDLIETMTSSVAATVAAADETRRMLRESFADIAKLDYEPQSLGGTTDEAMRVFYELYTATNRAHFEHNRACRPRSDMPESFSEAGEAANEGGNVGSGSPRGADVFADVMTNGPADPRRTMMFLMKLAKLRPMHRKRVECTAQMLTQISATYRDVAHSDAFLTAKLGACRGPGDAAEAVSWGFASNLRWAVWDATKYWVHKRHKQEEQSRLHLDDWIQREHALKALSELPRVALGSLLCAAWEAAQHTSLIRFPEEPKSWGSWLKGAFKHEEDSSPHKTEFHVHCEALKSTGALTDELHHNLMWMLWNTAWYVANKSRNYAGEARESLVRAERHLQRAFRAEQPWRGVNLGGWFVVQPGPSTHFWQALPEEARTLRSEWQICEALGRDAATKALRDHWRSYFGKKDFADMKASGLSHVRLSIGTWCVLGPRHGEPFIGPCLEEIDRALDMIEEEGLRVVLDLRGSENSEASNGRADRDWSVRKWDVQASLTALEVLATRYVRRPCVCGIGVCNEPSMSIPAKILAKYYERAVQTVRQAGMRAGEVAVLLPIFGEIRTPEFLDLWEANYPRYEDCVFDFHLKQSFGTYWSMKTLERHMEAAAARATLLKNIPTCCVGEWSLALPPRAIVGCDKQALRDIYERFARLQLEAFETATHGWFFWSWKSSAGLPWSLRDLLRKRVLAVPSHGRVADVAKS